MTSGVMHRIKHYVQYGNAYTDATLVAAIGLGALLLLGLAFLIPKATAESVRDGLTIIAEILGVFLGAVLAIAAFLRERRFNSEQLLRSVLQKYREEIQQGIITVNLARKQVVERISNGEIGLDEPIYIQPPGQPSSESWGDIVYRLSTLVSIFSEELGTATVEEVKDDLRRLGLSRHKIIQVLYVEAAEPAVDAQDFLQFVGDTLEPACITPDFFSLQMYEFANWVLDEYARDGVDEALRTCHRVSEFLQSRTLVASVLVPTLTAVLSVLMIFGVTDATVYIPPYGLVVVVIVTGFVLSVILALLLVGKMVT